MQFEDIYRLEVIDALEKDHELDFKDIRSSKYLQKGICPSCGERTLYIARDKPYQLKCNRLNQCQHEEKTRERYSYLFENLSERFPRSESNPMQLRTLTYSATADSTSARFKAGTSRDAAKWPMANGLTPFASPCAMATGKGLSTQPWCWPTAATRPVSSTK